MASGLDTQPADFTGLCDGWTTPDIDAELRSRLGEYIDGFMRALHAPGAEPRLPDQLTRADQEQPASDGAERAAPKKRARMSVMVKADGFGRSTNAGSEGKSPAGRTRKRPPPRVRPGHIESAASKHGVPPSVLGGKDRSPPRPHLRATFPPRACMPFVAFRFEQQRETPPLRPRVADKSATPKTRRSKRVVERSTMRVVNPVKAAHLTCAERPLPRSCLLSVTFPPSACASFARFSFGARPLPGQGKTKRRVRLSGTSLSAWVRA